MPQFKIVHIDSAYIEHLHKVDKRVQFNKGMRRPYVGVVLDVGGTQYFVPLESPKPNHAHIKAGGPVLKLQGGKFGIMGFNNMIPVETRCLVLFDISLEPDRQYRNLLYNQLDFCNDNHKLIMNRAENTYRKQTGGDKFYRKICCDFKRLEQAMGLFKKKTTYSKKL
jgi:protein AbiQ